MSFFLFVKDFRDCQEYTTLLHIAEFIIYRSSKHTHSGRETHVSVDERWDVKSLLAEYAVENTVIFRVIFTAQQALNLRRTGTGGNRIDGAYKSIRIREMLAHKSEHEVEVMTSKRLIHRNFTKEISDMRILHCKRAQAVPQVVKSENSFGSGLGTLISERHKRAAKFQSIRKIFLEKLLGKTEHAGSGDMRHARRHIDFVAGDKTISTEDLTLFRIPDYQLSARFGHSVKLVDVTTESCASPRLAESLLTKASDLTHRVGRAESVDNVEMVVAFVGMSQKTLRRKFALNGVSVYWWYDGIHYI